VPPIARALRGVLALRLYASSELRVSGRVTIVPSSRLRAAAGTFAEGFGKGGDGKGPGTAFSGLGFAAKERYAAAAAQAFRAQGYASSHWRGSDQGDIHVHSASLLVILQHGYQGQITSCIHQAI